MRAIGLAVWLLLSLGCALPAQSPRFVRHKVPLSPWCNLTTVYDQRTRICLATYQCGVVQAESVALTVVPTEVCEP
jgi:hypothetical protein